MVSTLWEHQGCLRLCLFFCLVLVPSLVGVRACIESLFFLLLLVHTAAGGASCGQTLSQPPLTDTRDGRGRKQEGAGLRRCSGIGSDARAAAGGGAPQKARADRQAPPAVADRAKTGATAAIVRHAPAVLYMLSELVGSCRPPLVSRRVASVWLAAAGLWVAAACTRQPHARGSRRGRWWRLRPNWLGGLNLSTLGSGLPAHHC